MRCDLQVLRADDELIVELRLLVARRQDLRADRTRAVNRLHDRLLRSAPRWSASWTWATVVRWCC
jgi:putative lipase involved disintegration of autophagic bodies